MAWFTADAIEFFRELELNNNKDWFVTNKPRYETSVKKPMEAFAAAMLERMQAVDPEIAMTPQQAVFRIYRDTRFSKDKTPYKTNAGLAITRGGKHNPSTPGLYFHIDAREVGIASGCYSLEAAPLRAIRQAIVDHATEFERLVTDPEFVAKFGTIRGDQNKILPPEFKEAAKSQPLLANKQFYYWASLAPESLQEPNLPDLVMSYLSTAGPLNDFFVRAMGQT
ncbi:MAG: DUF2461 domain-containing protein [Fimbriimonadaceae bacterium]|nr:DUF2461 domain-containing protein [Fimbriimonadaceae bacterium]